MGEATGKTFEVYASKTEEEAKALAETSPGAMCLTKDKKSIVFNGEVYSGDKLTAWQKDYLAKQEQAATEAKFSLQLAVSPGATFVKGVSTEQTVTVKATFDGKAVDLQSLKGTGVLADLADLSKWTKSSTGVYTVKKPVSDASTFGIEGAYNGIKKTGTKTVQAYYLIKYGVSTKGTLAAADIRTLGSRGPQASAAGSYDFSLTANSYAYVCIPDGVSIPGSLNQSKPQGVEGPLPVFFTNQGKVTDGSITYTVFRIADMQAASSHTIKFS